MLLTHVPGTNNYEHLKTVNNIKYYTFKEAAVAHGLLGDDNEYHLSLKEATEIKTRRLLSHLFALILADCKVSNAY